MTDAYSVGGRPITREPYRGRYRTNRRTGERQVWNGSRYVPESAATLAPEAADQLQSERSRLATSTRNANLGQQFLRHNQRQQTGGWVESIPGLNTLGRPDAQAMQGLTSQMLRENIQPGTSGTLNSEREMQLALAQYPSLQTAGPINRTRVLRLQIERDLQAARVNALEQYARSRRNVDGFEQWWSAQAPNVRASIEARYAATNGPVDEQFDPRTGAQRPNPPPRPTSVPPEAQWDPDRRRWVLP